MSVQFKTDGSTVLTDDESKALREYAEAARMYDAAQRKADRACEEHAAADMALNDANHALFLAENRLRDARKALEATKAFKVEG